MLHVIKVLDDLTTGTSLLHKLDIATGNDDMYQLYTVHLGSSRYTEYKEIWIDNQLHIYIPLPYSRKSLQDFSLAELQQFGFRVADLLEMRFAGITGLIFHFENNSWAHLAHQLKTSLQAKVVYGYSYLSVGETLRHMLTIADQIICASFVAHHFLQQQYPPFRHKISTIYNYPEWLTSHIHRPQPSLLPVLGLPADTPLILFNKQLAAPGYDMQPLLESFKKLKEAYPAARLFLLHESGLSTYAGIMNLALESSISFIQHISADQEAALYASASLVVVPELTEENFLYMPLLQLAGAAIVLDTNPSDNPWFAELIQQRLIETDMLQYGDQLDLAGALPGSLAAKQFIAPPFKPANGLVAAQLYNFPIVFG
ncbi:hypothetical protein ECE50_025380 [Chitinophaga sp. Mgbs1]|uniref:Uncharacterized protein n=1 Tax=Chitinophaga solisilvae TaxID=1233460 RepID=A0A433WL08_9BACT|nr:hypothetical protein [Chitinophaga solisilvae]